MSVSKQNSFLMEISGIGSSVSKHLYVICENPCSLQKVVVVPMQTARGIYDTTTEIDPKTTTHKFLKHKSYMAYYEAQVIGISDIESLISDGKAVKKDNFDNNTFLKIKKGIVKSDETPDEVITCYEHMLENTCCTNPVP